MSKRKYKIEVLTTPVTGCAISGQTKRELIRRFQRMEGSLDCFTSAYVRVCSQSLCLWRNECQEIERHGDVYEQIA